MSVSNPAVQPVQYLKSVGPRRAALLGRLGIGTVWDLLYHFPRAYHDRSLIKPAHACVHGEQATLQGVVAAAQEQKPRRGLTITKLVLQDGAGIFYAVWFNQPYIKKQLPTGTRLLVTGKVERGYGAVQVAVSDYEVLDGEETLHAGRIVPVYPLTGQLTQRLMRSVVRQALDEWAGQMDEFLPPALPARYHLPALSTALVQIHFPDTEREARRAQKRFIFEELFLLQLVLAGRRRRLVRQEKGHSYRPAGELVRRLLDTLPFQLTAGQEQAWREICRDMDAAAPMNRLLQGDVGAGKTVVAVLTLLRAVESGLQGALMAPTETLAGQHYLSLCRLLEPLGVKTALLAGGMKNREREAVLAGLQSGETGLVVGTHALIQEVVQFQRLAVVVIDEQHRFGVRQRAHLQYKGRHPDVLVMTATPIPRTLALTLYGDLDVSTIKELPPGRRPVQTLACAPAQLPDVYRMILEQVREGRQAYVVCPLVEESEKLDVQAAVDLAAALAAGPLKSCRTGLLHGRLKAAEKEQVMHAFRGGEIDVLVATTVVEVGVDVPNATVMVILDADRFGLAQLHQLRGRVGRGAHQSYCILVSGARTEEARTRLAAMTATTDGFVLAEKDLQLRGPGEFTGTRQSGLPDLKIADLVRDWRALETARSEAVKLITADPDLTAPEHRALAEELKRRFSRSGYLEIS
nr:ATP-dependent DNA helicase RecG [Desulfotomaculum copahuensis]